MNRKPVNRLYHPVAPVVSLLVMTTPAFAHAPIMGIGGVFGGLLHALFIPEHGASLVALGAVLGIQETSPRRSGLLIFGAALVCGLVLAGFGIQPGPAADVLLIAMCILGILMAAAWAPPRVAWLLSAVTGLTFALDSTPETTAVDETIRMLIGSGLGAVVTLVIVTEGSVVLQGSAQRLVARVLGSWIAASAILVLSLRLVTRFSVS